METLCPLCKSVLSTDKHREVLDRYQAEANKKFASQKALIEEQMQEKLLEAEREKEKWKEAQNELLDEKVAEARQLAREEASREAGEDSAAMTSRIEELEGQLRSRDEGLERRAADAEKRAEAAERSAKERSEEAERLTSEKVRLARQDAELDAQKASLALREMESENAKLRTELDSKVKVFEEFKRKQDTRAGWLRGDGGEAALLAALKKRFPGDIFDQEQKGREQADIIQHIVTSDGKLDTPICYDTKDNKAATPADVQKAKNYRAIHKTPHVLLVTPVLPAQSNQGIALKDGVMVVHPFLAPEVASVIRDGLVRIHEVGESAGGRDGKEASLFKFVTGDEFISLMRHAHESYEKLRAIREKEKKYHEKVWEDQEEAARQAVAQFSSIQERISEITRSERTRV